MTQTEGEKELILGNRQLISLFFVVVALCGVFFALGYLIGRNGSSKTAAAAASTDNNATPPAEPVSAAQESTPPPSETARADAASAPESITTATQPVATQTQPARDTPPAPKPSPAKPAGPASVMVPEVGATYLQVTALRRGDADNLVKTLREQNLPALLADSSKPDLFRVLVGPYHQTAQVAEAKSRLKTLGFADAFVQK